MKRLLLVIGVCVLLLGAHPECYTNDLPMVDPPIVGIWSVRTGVVPSTMGAEFFADGTGEPYDLELFPGAPQFDGTFKWFYDDPHIVIRRDTMDGVHYYIGDFSSETSIIGSEVAGTSSNDLARVAEWLGNKVE